MIGSISVHTLRSTGGNRLNTATNATSLLKIEGNLMLLDPTKALYKARESFVISGIVTFLDGKRLCLKATVQRAHSEQTIVGLKEVREALKNGLRIAAETVVKGVRIVMGWIKVRGKSFEVRLSIPEHILIPIYASKRQYMPSALN